jgi:Predicted Zn-dependent hydrolases of the beta-lactamase fold
MKVTRRTTLRLGAGTAAALAMPASLRLALAQDRSSDRYPTDGGEIVVYPIAHASIVLEVPGMVIYVDPVGEADAYEGLPPPDLVLITHEHGDHFSPDTLDVTVSAQSQFITNPSVYEKLSEDYRARATAMKNGDTTEVGDVQIEAIPAYNMTEDRLQYHPKGRDNGYVLTIDGRRVYIAGDTEDTPEMRALRNIDVAFIPMNLPYTMDIDQAASAVIEFKPANVYPYHYRGSDVEAFAAKVREGAPEVNVILGPWYG